MDVSNLTKDQLERLQVEKEEELQLSLQSLSIVEIKGAELSRKATQISLDRKDLEPAIIQAKHNVRRINSELRILKTLIWQELSKGR